MAEKELEQTSSRRRSRGGRHAARVVGRKLGRKFAAAAILNKTILFPAGEETHEFIKDVDQVYNKLALIAIR